MTIEELARKRNRHRKHVLDWMTEQGNAGYYRTNDQAPAWGDYKEAEAELSRALLALGTGEEITR